MGCGGSKEQLKVVPEVIVAAPPASAEAKSASTSFAAVHQETALQRELNAIEKIAERSQKAVLPSIQKNIQFDILLSDPDSTSPVPIQQGQSSRLTLPKIAPKVSNESLARSADELKERLAEKEAIVAMNRELDNVRKQEKIAANEEKKRLVLERKRMQMESSGGDIDGQVDLEEEIDE